MWVYRYYTLTEEERKALARSYCTSIDRIYSEAVQVGYYQPDGTWFKHSNHDCVGSAIDQIRYINGALK